MKCATDKEMLHWVAGSLPADRAAELERHLAQCQGCARRRDDLVATTRRLQPDPGEFDDPALADDVMTLIRLDRARPAPTRRTGMHPVWWLAPVAAAAALIVAVLVWPRPAPGPDGFQVRSGADDPDRWISIQVFCSSQQGYRPVTRQIRPDDALAFSYWNRSETYRHLMVLAVDAGGRVYWYYPAHTREDHDPGSIGIGRTRAQLPDAIRHALRPGPLRLFALFSGKTLRVSEVEAVVARNLASANDLAHLDRLSLPGTGQHSLMLEVTTVE